MKSDIQIAQEAVMKPIREIASSIGLDDEQIEFYGKYKAKIDVNRISKEKKGKLVLVTAMSPTPAGEGKSTVTIGLADAFKKLGKKSIIALREPSLGPVMGIKGGACGGGYAQVIPMEEINLHFTGDMHALTCATNALAAFIDNHIYQGNELQIDSRRVIWKRAVDLNDRALRKVIVGLGGPIQGVPREDGFDITVASEMMAILCLARDLNNLKQRLENIVIGYTFEKVPVTVKDLNVQGALTLLLKDALKPNLVQTLEHTPAIVHGGPFANIAHGCNSVIATNAALALGEIVVTEAGFGADLGAQKFLEIKVPQLQKVPDIVVIVATIRSLKMHGGVSLSGLTEGENLEALEKGFANLEKHIENMTEHYGLPAVVALNEFVTDTPQEKELVQTLCQKKGISCISTSVWENGGNGGVDLAKEVLHLLEHSTPQFHAVCEENSTIQEQIEAIATKIYGASSVQYTKEAKLQLKQLKNNGWDHLPVCIAKTQYSFSDDATLLGRPTGFELTVRSLVPKLGAGFVVALTGNILTMPGLPKKPAALEMDVLEDGRATGLF
ncbi:formate--tetrahydrofolate ligase [Granulicatella elegans]|uniref:formate--tetrahydrofolate ligase n=1 Tax=Granulicatella elegans TaxID=137732 RepID=UPI001D133010|nr:formate--tetrahydrofolate ligase [Granulicatella elegans]UEA31025.1 formate--tetrahydrofolate ligase [Granulicatella elegans]